MNKKMIKRKNNKEVITMEELKKEINNQIEILKELIKQEKDEEVKKQRKVVDKLLNQYLKDL